MKIVQNEITERAKQIATGETQKVGNLKNKILEDVCQTVKFVPLSHPKQARPVSPTSLCSNLPPRTSSDKTHSLSTSSSLLHDLPQVMTDERKSRCLVDSDSLDASIKFENPDNNKKNSNNELVIAEAAKILLQNGLNGTNAAAAAAVATATATLLTAAANFQLPISSATLSSLRTSSTSNSEVTAAAAHAHIVAIAAAAAAVNASSKNLVALPNSLSSAKKILKLQEQVDCNLRNNDDLSSVPINKNNSDIQYTTNDMFNNTVNKIITSTSFSTQQRIAKSKKSVTTINMPSLDLGVGFSGTNLKLISSGAVSSVNSHPISSNITSANNSNHNSRSTSNSSSSNCSEIGHASISVHMNNICNTNTINNTGIHQYYHQHRHYNNNTNNNHACAHSSNIMGNKHLGGRLKFFKDGKFILELARSKDNEKGGWISVPRKQFHGNPATGTTSTITPSSSVTSAISATASPVATSPIGISGNIIVAFPKNECSNSLSFSDDNSSIQSSPWQRDQSWKQAMPRKNLSKAMSFFYQRFTHMQLTPLARRKSHAKRRKPYDVSTVGNELLFLQYIAISENEEEELAEEIISKTGNMNEENNKPSTENIIVNSACGNEISIPNDRNVNKIDENKGNDRQKRGDGNKSDNNKLNNEKRDFNMVDRETSEKNEDIVKCRLNINNEMKDLKSAKVFFDGKLKTKRIDVKRLEKYKYKSRMKLSVIVQKLIDISILHPRSNSHCNSKVIHHTVPPPPSFYPQLIQMPKTLPLMSTTHQTVYQNVSPPTSNMSTTTSRLVEYHQQHVSPRKRILRELEKVSLDDNTISGGSKRSRVKGCHMEYNGISQYVRKQSLLNADSNVSSTISSNEVSTIKAINKNKTLTTSAPTKHYSSYSIHSLLGGSEEEDISRVDTLLINKSDSTATITANNHQSYNSITNVNLSSPKSTERDADNKSPLTFARKIKKSPTYICHLHDAHSDHDHEQHSPHSTSDCSPNTFQKLKCVNFPEHSLSTNNFYINHQQQKHQNYIQSIPLVSEYQNTYYSSYVTSLNNLTSSETNSISNTSTTSIPIHNNRTNLSMSNSVRHSTLPFSVMSTTGESVLSSSTSSLSTSTVTSRHIPIQRDFSPCRSLTSSPHPVGYKTVPKKTASIRRQFASPTSSCSNNCSSPLYESRLNILDENANINTDRRTPASLLQHQHLMQRCVSNTVISNSFTPSMLHSYSYMYSPLSVVNTTVTNSHSSTSNVIAPSSSTYIPSIVCSPYYYPYISTLAAMRHSHLWMQHYQNAAMSSSPSLLQGRVPSLLTTPRFQTSYNHGYPYNGISNAAALAAAVAAAASFGNTSIHQHSSTLTNNALFSNMASVSGVLDTTSLITIPSTQSPLPEVGLSTEVLPNHLMTDNTADLLKTSKSIFKVSPEVTISSRSFSSSTSLIYSVNSKDAQSSDVPLNLSKH